MDRNVEAGHTTFVRCRIVDATVLMRCRFGLMSVCITMIDKGVVYCELVTGEKSDINAASLTVYHEPPWNWGVVSSMEGPITNPINAGHRKSKTRDPRYLDTDVGTG